ncbi:hypothetical protein BC830DRAFT_1118887 [Chytriomyces sp. MP71]|nr:hypothetical protein BC830DRAFT_1118887 [Chytriomyces sp. MP71]
MREKWVAKRMAETVLPVPESDAVTYELPPKSIHMADKLDAYLTKLSSELLAWHRINNPSRAFADSARLPALPKGYELHGFPRQDVGSKHIDFYLFGHPTGRKFRSMREFLPHLLYLAGDQVSRCECKICPASPAVHRARTKEPVSYTSSLLSSSFVSTKEGSEEDEKWDPSYAGTVEEDGNVPPPASRKRGSSTGFSVIIPRQNEQKRPKKKAFVVSSEVSEDAEEEDSDSTEKSASGRGFRLNLSKKPTSPEQSDRQDLQKSSASGVSSKYRGSAFASKSGAPRSKDSSQPWHISLSEKHTTKPARIHNERQHSFAPRSSSISVSTLPASNSQPRFSTTHREPSSQPQPMEPIPHSRAHQRSGPSLRAATATDQPSLKRVTNRHQVVFHRHELVWLNVYVVCKAHPVTTMDTLSHHLEKFISNQTVFWPCLVLDELSRHLPVTSDTPGDKIVQVHNPHPIIVQDTPNNLDGIHIRARSTTPLRPALNRNEVEAAGSGVDLYRVEPLQLDGATLLLRACDLQPWSAVAARAETMLHSLVLPALEDLELYTRIESGVASRYMAAMQAALRSVKGRLNVFGYKGGAEVVVTKVPADVVGDAVLATVRDKSWRGLQVGGEVVHLGDVVRVFSKACVMFDLNGTSSGGLERKCFPDLRLDSRICSAAGNQILAIDELLVEVVRVHFREGQRPPELFGYVCLLEEVQRSVFQVKRCWFAPKNGAGKSFLQLVSVPVKEGYAGKLDCRWDCCALGPRVSSFVGSDNIVFGTGIESIL